MMEQPDLIQFAEELNEREREGLTRLARRAALSRAEAEDIVQEAWLALLQDPVMAAKGGAAIMLAWLRCVVQRKAISARRSPHRRRVQSLDALPEAALLLARERSAEADDDRHARRKAILEKLRQRDEKSASLLEDYLGGEKRGKEVAAERGLTERALQCKISRLRHQLCAQEAQLLAAEGGA